MVARHSCGMDTRKGRLSLCALVQIMIYISPSRVAAILDERHPSTVMDYMSQATIERDKTVVTDRSCDDDGC